MDDGNGAVPSDQIAQQSMMAVSQFACGTCHEPMMARIPPFRVFNFPECSGLVMSHERMSKCPKCGTVYVPLIKGVKQSGEMELVWKAISTPEIKAPTQEEIQKVTSTKKM